VKRPSQDVAGRPKIRDLRPNVAGRPAVSTSAIDPVAFHQAFHNRMSAGADDAALIEDFVDFLGGEDEFEVGQVSAPDPVFRERLRSRLWRNYVLAFLRRGSEPH
jgi:hypothetical protein